MTNKEKADCLIELHRERLGKYKQTRDIEFRVNIALWTLIIVSGYYINKEIVLCSRNDYFIFIILYLLISILLAFGHFKFWMKPIQKSEDVDNFYINQYREKIEELADIQIEKHKPYNKYWICYEVGITAFLLCIIFIYILL